MKKILCILMFVAVLLIPSVVGAVAVDVASTQKITAELTVVKMTGMADGETHAVKGPIKAVWLQMTDDVGDTGFANMATSISGSTVTFTFHFGDSAGSSRTGHLFIVR